MKGRRSSRSAAVVLAGCVGLAVMTPGLALAAPVAGVTTEAECEALGYTWTDGVCDDGVTAQPEATLDGTGTGTGTGTGSTSTETSDESDGSDDSTGGGSPAVLPETPEQSNEDSSQLPVGNDGQPPAENNEQQPPAENNEQQPPAENNEQQPPAENNDEQPPATEDVENAVPDLQKEIDDLLPGTDKIGLPDLPTIPQPVDGKFTNVNDACLNAISQLKFPAGASGLGNLSSQLQGFCRGLDTTDVHVCLEHLRDVVKHLCPTVIEYNTTINFVNTHVSYEWWGAYWHHRYDVDCDELTYDEANAILDWDRSDPFRLDRDDDGEACEANAHGDDVETVVYDSYPVGGVATGDGSTDSGASGVEVALAAGALGGLGVTGLTLARRFARQG
jgi:hypothetical protein